MNTETLLIFSILLLFGILTIVTVYEVLTNKSLPPRESFHYLAFIIGCPLFGILLYLLLTKRLKKKIVS